MKNLFIISLFFVKLVYSQPQIKLQEIATNLVSPIGMSYPEDGTGRLFVIEQRGLIYIIDKNQKLLDKPFLDISKSVVKLTARYDERGLLGLAFHPKYKENGRFFVYYSSSLPVTGQDHVAILSEFKVDPKDPNRALPAEKVLMKINQPEWNHNGGQLLFGPDGFLYFGLGDGGSGGDPHGTIGNGQDLSNVLGKILRIDVNGKQPYSIPADNPFVGQKNVASEIWAYGLRNPWRFSIDKVTGRLFCGDVGQNKYEEVDIVEKGKNYGWRIMEGVHCFNPETNCDKTNLVLPITEYDRSEGSSVTGGYVYRGKAIADLYGKYIFADWRGVLFALTEKQDKTWERVQLKTDYSDFKNLNINSLGEDSEGEIYLMVQDLDGPFQTSGKVLKLVR
ncbi:MAG: PQQ-dependent sugar dehydrogenase [Bacteroidota bacterium]|nr:PQQ-dependent sugar dehydrogenase [Bacteroidota bacterium]